MSDRIHRALDGELAIADLTPDECTELQRYRAAICAAIYPTRRWRPIDVAPEVMQRVAPGRGRRALHAVRHALWSPRSLSFRPVYGLAGALALTVVLWASRAVPARLGATAPEPIVVQFRMSERDAHEVALVGDFNGWRPEHQLRRTGDGVWALDVALKPGVYNYVFIVDGATVRLDPLAPHVTDGFGGQSSRLAVLSSSLRS